MHSISPGRHDQIEVRTSYIARESVEIFDLSVDILVLGY